MVKNFKAMALILFFLTAFATDKQDEFGDCNVKSPYALTNTNELSLSKEEHVFATLQKVDKKLDEMIAYITEKIRVEPKNNNQLIPLTETAKRLQKTLEEATNAQNWIQQELKTTENLTVLYRQLQNEAPHGVIITILQVTNEMGKDHWNLKKLFGCREEVRIINSLDYHFFRVGIKRCLSAESNGLPSFQIYTNDGLLKKNELVPYTATANVLHYGCGDGTVQLFTFYDPAESYYHIVNHRYWFYVELTALVMTLVLMKTYLDPEAMIWNFMDIWKFKFATLQLISFAIHATLVLAKYVTSDISAPIFPPNKTTGWRWWWDLGKTFVSDFVNLCFVIAGAIAKVVLYFAPLPNVFEVQGHWTDYFWSLTIALPGFFAVLGYTLMFGQIGFQLVSLERGDGYYSTYNNSCGILPDGGWHTFSCWEKLTEGALFYWVGPITEGYRYPSLGSSPPGFLIWFSVGLMIKFIKIWMIEPLLMTQAYVSNRILEWKGKGCPLPYCQKLMIKPNPDLLKDTCENTETTKKYQAVALAIFGAFFYVLSLLTGSSMMMLFSAIPILHGIFYLFNLVPNNDRVYKLVKYNSWLQIILVGFTLLQFLMDENYSGKGEMKAEMIYGMIHFYNIGGLIGNYLQMLAVILLYGGVIRFVMRKLKLMWYHPNHEHDLNYTHMVRLYNVVMEVLFKDPKVGKRLKSEDYALNAENLSFAQKFQKEVGGRVRNCKVCYWGFIALGLSFFMYFLGTFPGAMGEYSE